MRPSTRPICGIALVAATLAACGSEPTAAPPVATLASTSPAATTAARHHSTRTFSRPFDVTLPPWLPAEPAIEQSGFVTWLSADGVDRAVRVLRPAVVYPPGTREVQPPPADLRAYLLGLADHGAQVIDETSSTVDGRPATLVTASTTIEMDGVLGCPETGMRPADCFGLIPDAVLRIAVVDTGDGPLLIWLREPSRSDVTTDAAAFAAMLDTVHFTDRPVDVTTTATSAPLDGTYTWTITADDARLHGTPADAAPAALATHPWVFTIELAEHRWHLTHVDGPTHQPVDEGAGTYTVSDDTITFTWHGNVLSFSFERDTDGALQLRGVDPMDAGDRFVWTTEPWRPVP